jgi:hypothetical protein
MSNLTSPVSQPIGLFRQGPRQTNSEVRSGA